MLMRYEGVIVRHAAIPFAGVFVAQKAVFYFSVLQTAPYKRAGLMPFSTAAAWAVMIQVHRA